MGGLLRKIQRTAGRLSAQHDLAALSADLRPPGGWNDCGRSVMRAATALDDERVRAAIIALGPNGAEHAAKLRASFAASREVLLLALQTLDSGIALVDGISPPAVWD